MKKFLSVLMATCICATMVGCSKSGEPSEIDSSSSASFESDETTVKYQPSDEIINADFPSGLVQIGDEIFHIGGFVTVKEVCEQLKGKYTYEEQFYDREYDLKNRAVLHMTGVEDENLKIYLEYISPAQDEEKIVPNCVVMEIYPDNAYTSSNMWLPTGIPYVGEADRLEEICAVFDAKGYKDVTDEVEGKGFMNEGFANNVGCYITNYLDMYSIFSVELEGVNLRGVTPTTTLELFHRQDSEKSSFSYGNYIAFWEEALERIGYWKSALR